MAGSIPWRLRGGWSVGIWFDRGLWPAGGFLLLALAALVVGGAIGLLLERGLLRFFYGSDDVLVVLVTYAAFLILENLVLQVWGWNAYPPTSRRPCSAR